MKNVNVADFSTHLWFRLQLVSSPICIWAAFSYHIEDFFVAIAYMVAYGLLSIVPCVSYAIILYVFLNWSEETRKVPYKFYVAGLLNIPIYIFFPLLNIYCYGLWSEELMIGKEIYFLLIITFISQLSIYWTIKKHFAVVEEKIDENIASLIHTIGRKDNKKEADN